MLWGNGRIDAAVARRIAVKLASGLSDLRRSADLQKGFAVELERLARAQQLGLPAAERRHDAQTALLCILVEIKRARRAARA